MISETRLYLLVLCWQLVSLSKAMHWPSVIRYSGCLTETELVFLTLTMSETPPPFCLIVQIWGVSLLLVVYALEYVFANEVVYVGKRPCVLIICAILLQEVTLQIIYPDAALVALHLHVIASCS